MLSHILKEQKVGQPLCRIRKRLSHVLCQLLLVWLVLSAIATITVIGLTKSAAAQIPATTTEILTDSFPLLTVTFACNVAQIVTDTFRLVEDGQRQVIAARSLELGDAPTQVAIFLDLFRREGTKGPTALQTLLALGAKGNTLRGQLVRFSEKELVFAGWDSLGIFIPSQDLVTAHSIITNVNFTYDVNSLINKLDDLSTNDAQLATLGDSPTTGLVGMLDQLLGQFNSATPIQRALVVFSDGTDTRATQSDRERLIAHAQANGIPIYTFFVATSIENDQAFLYTLAEQTGGLPVTIAGADASLPENQVELQDLLSNLFAKQPQCQLAYRTQRAEARKIEVFTELTKSVASGYIPSIPVEPPTVTVAPILVSPLVSTSITATLIVSTNWQFQDSYPDRRIQAIEYEIEGITTTRMVPLVQKFPLTSAAPLSTVVEILTMPVLAGSYAANSYAIKVRVTDDVGLVGEDVEPFALFVPTPEPTVTATIPIWREQWATRLKNWSDRFSLYRQGVYFQLTEIVLWSLTSLLFGLLLIQWLTRREWQREQEEAILAGGAIEPEASLVRIHSDPNAPPLLHMVPLSYHRGIKIPEELYHPVWKQQQSNGSYQQFSDAFQAIISPRGNQFFLLRTIAKSEHSPKQAPIKIRVAETSSSFDLVKEQPWDEPEFGPLHHGDVLQLDDTHYKFMHLQKNDPIPSNAQEETDKVTSATPWWRRLFQPNASRQKG